MGGTKASLRFRSASIWKESDHDILANIHSLGCNSGQSHAPRLDWGSVDPGVSSSWSWLKELGRMRGYTGHNSQGEPPCEQRHKDGGTQALAGQGLGGLSFRCQALQCGSLDAGEQELRPSFLKSFSGTLRRRLSSSVCLSYSSDRKAEPLPPFILPPSLFLSVKSVLALYLLDGRELG